MLNEKLLFPETDPEEKKQNVATFPSEKIQNSLSIVESSRPADLSAIHNTSKMKKIKPVCLPGLRVYTLNGVRQTRYVCILRKNTTVTFVCMDPALLQCDNAALCRTMCDDNEKQSSTEHWTQAVCITLACNTQLQIGIRPDGWLYRICKKEDKAVIEIEKEANVSQSTHQQLVLFLESVLAVDHWKLHTQVDVVSIRALLSMRLHERSICLADGCGFDVDAAQMSKATTAASTQQKMDAVVSLQNLFN
jgi:hypothetical protein